MPVARLHDADVAPVDGGERHPVHRKLPRPEAKMDPRRERIGLQSGFAVQRDDRAVGQGSVFAKEHPLLVQNSDFVLRDNDRSKEDAQYCLMQNHNQE